MWQTAKVFTKAEGFGKGRELQENRIIDIRPNETHKQALVRQGFNPKESRIEVI
jgi:hypothetical protein